MDALFFFRHSEFGDRELQFALRGIARHAPWIRKVWIFGDRPAFLRACAVGLGLGRHSIAPSVRKPEVRRLNSVTTGADVAVGS